MPTTNIIPFDELLLNAESDAVYALDPLRTGGAQSGAILPSPLFNKALAQTSIFSAAFCAALVNKGYSPMDAPFATLVALLGNIKTSADFEDTMIVVAYASSMTFDAATSSGFETTLTGNVAASTLTGNSTGQIITFVIHQDGTGGRTFVWPSGLTPAGPICPQPGSTTVQVFQQLASSAILIPVGSMIWITSSGVVLQPAPNVVSVSTSGTSSNAYSRIIEQVNCSGGAITRSLPSAIGTSGFIWSFKKMDTSANAITIQPLVGGQTIDGFPNYTIGNPYNSFDIASTGANFILI